MHHIIPLNEKIRILSRITKDISYRSNYRKAGSNTLSQNQFLILRILFSSGSKTAGVLAEFLEISRAAASNNIEYLVKKKYVKRTENPEDRRSVRVSILRSGRAIVERYNEIHNQKINTILSYFSKDEEKHFSNLLDKYIYHLIGTEDSFSLFCLQCGGKYEGICPVGEHQNDCYFQVTKGSNSS